MKKLSSFDEIRWALPSLEEKKDYFVADIMPSTFSAYVKLLHPFYEDTEITDHSMGWDEYYHPWSSRKQQMADEIVEQAKLYGGTTRAPHLRSISWRELAKKYSVVFNEGITGNAFQRGMPDGKWPRYLIGPAAGELTNGMTQALVDLLKPYTTNEDCFFYFWCLATKIPKNPHDWGDVLYEGLLKDVALFLDGKIEEVNRTPTYWIPKSRQWLVCSDYDLDFTLVGGSEELIEGLLNSQSLECVRCELGSKISS